MLFRSYSGGIVSCQMPESEGNNFSFHYKSEDGVKQFGYLRVAAFFCKYANSDGVGANSDVTGTTDWNGTNGSVWAGMPVHLPRPSVAFCAVGGGGNWQVPSILTVTPPNGGNTPMDYSNSSGFTGAAYRQEHWVWRPLKTSTDSYTNNVDLVQWQPKTLNQLGGGIKVHWAIATI